MRFWLTDGVFHREGTNRDVEMVSNDPKYEDRGTPFEIPDDAEAVIVPEGTTCVGMRALGREPTMGSAADPIHLAWTKLRKVVLPEGVEELGNWAFAYCALLEDIALPASMVKLGSQVFLDTGIRSIVVPESMQEIGTSCFSSCGKLEKITLPSKPIHISGDAFTNCKSLKRLNVPPRLTDGFFPRKPGYEGKSLMLLGCSALEELCIPEHATEIIPYAIATCTSLTEAVIPKGIKSIEALAFENCTLLKKLVIPASVRKVDPSAFRRCAGLEHIVLMGAFKGFESAFPDSPNVVRVELPDGNEGKAAAAFPNAEIYNLEGKLLRSPNEKGPSGESESDASPALNGEIVAKSGVPKLKNATYELALGSRNFQVSCKGALALNKQTKLALSNAEPEEGTELYDAKELSDVNFGDLYEIDPHTGITVEKLKLERTYVVGGSIRYCSPLLLEEIRLRAVAFANVVAACTEPKNVLKILDYVPKKKNQTLYKGRVTPILRCALADHGGDALALIAKNISDTELELNIKRVYIGEDAYKSAKDCYMQAIPGVPKSRKSKRG